MILEDVNEVERWFLDRNTDEFKKRIGPSIRKGAPATARRSALMVSGARARHLNRLDSLETDVAIINLEDGVAPEEKESARAMTGFFLSRLEATRSLLVIRVNPLDEGGMDDLEALLPLKPDAVRIPKVKSPSELEPVLKILPASIALHLSIETREAFGSIRDFRIDPRIDTFYLGILDLMISLGVPFSSLKRDNPLIQNILSRFFLESRLTGARPVSFVFQTHRDMDEFRAWLELEKLIGYRSKGCISPDQAKVVNEFFRPEPAEIERADIIVRRFEEMAAQGVTGFADEKYGFIDEPIYKDALSILGEAEKEKRLNDETEKTNTESKKPDRTTLRPTPLF